MGAHAIEPQLLGARKQNRTHGNDEATWFAMHALLGD